MWIEYVNYRLEENKRRQRALKRQICAFLLQLEFVRLNRILWIHFSQITRPHFEHQITLQDANIAGFWETIDSTTNRISPWNCMRQFWSSPNSDVNISDESQYHYLNWSNLVWRNFSVLGAAASLCFNSNIESSRRNINLDCMDSYTGSVFELYIYFNSRFLRSK